MKAKLKLKQVQYFLVTCCYPLDSHLSCVQCCPTFKQQRWSFQGSGKHESLYLKLVHSFWKKPYDGNILHHVSSESVWCFPFLNIQVTFLLDLVLPTVFFLCHENYILIVSFKLKVAHTEAKKLRLKCHDSISFKQEKLLLVKSVITHTLQ